MTSLHNLCDRALAHGEEFQLQWDDAGRCSSVAEQRFRKARVKGSNPLTGSRLPT